MQVYPSESVLRADPGARILIDHWKENAGALGLNDAMVFFNFPLFREEEKLLVSDLVLISPQHGVLLVSTPSGNVARAQEQLDGAFNQVFSRLVRYPRLRSGRANLKFNLDACVWMPEGHATAEVRVGFASLDALINGLRLAAPIETDVFEELVSTLDGSPDPGIGRTCSASRECILACGLSAARAICHEAGVAGEVEGGRARDWCRRWDGEEDHVIGIAEG